MESHFSPLSVLYLLIKNFESFPKFLLKMFLFLIMNLRLYQIAQLAVIWLLLVLQPFKLIGKIHKLLKRFAAPGGERRALLELAN